MNNTSRPTIFFLKGLPASGKSTWALGKIDELKQDNVVYINRDSVRKQMFPNNYDNFWNGYKFNSVNENSVTKFCEEMLLDGLKNSKNIIIDNLNLNPKYEKEMRNYAKMFDYQFELIDLTHISLFTCAERDSKRKDSVGFAFIKEVYNKWIGGKFDKTKFYTPPMNAPLCLICDLDGTLADISHRNPYDASNCYEDAVRQHVANLLHATIEYYSSYNQSIALFFFSGRDDKFKNDTLRWLNDKAGMGKYGFVLEMRKTGDRTKDATIKFNMFDHLIKDKYNVLMVIDDRPQVVNMWQKLGLNVVCVNQDCYFDF